MTRKSPFNGAPPAAFDHDGVDGPGGSKPRASAARIPFVEIEHGAIAVLTPEDAARRGVGVRPATHQDLEIAGRRDLIPLIAPPKA